MKITLDEIKKLINEELNGTPNPTVSAPPHEESLSQKIYKTFSDFNYKLNSYENQLTRFYQDQLNKMLKGKNVIINASIGYGQVKKSYTITVKAAQIVFYYKEYVVVLVGRSKGDKKDREYILDDSFDVKVVAAPVLSEPKTAEEPENPQAPKISSPKSQQPLNPTMKQSKGPSPSLSSGGNAPVQSQPKV